MFLNEHLSIVSQQVRKTNHFVGLSKRQILKLPSSDHRCKQFDAKFTNKACF